MRAVHMLLHAPEGERSLILIDLHAADKQGNVEKASALRLHTNFKYSAAGEYLIFGGVPPEVSLSRHLQAYLTIIRPLSRISHCQD